MDPKRIYHTFKACRLCGADGGYKMPIYQDFVDLSDSDIDLRQKIQECVQIEVFDGDKMPPLVCGVCVDKLDEYYQFKEICVDTNLKTRKKLGLPTNTLKPMPDKKEIIKKEIDALQAKLDMKAHAKREAALKQQETQLKNKAKELKTKEDNLKQKETTLNKLDTELKTRQQQLDTMDTQLKTREAEIQQKETVDKAKDYQKERAELKKDIKNLKAKENYYKGRQEITQRKFEAEIEKLKLEVTKLQAEREGVKRKRDRESSEVDRSSRSSSVTSKPAKRPKRSVTPAKDDIDTTSNSSVMETPPPPKKAKEKNTEPPSKRIKTSSRQSTVPDPPAVDPPPVDRPVCPVCRTTFKNKQVTSKHLNRTHVVTFTSPKLTCDACKLWFVTLDETASHHRAHKTDSIPYRCGYCCMRFDSDADYHGHFAKYDCTPYYTVPDVQCLDCWNYFATETLKCQHKCMGEDGRPGGKCNKCNVDIPAWKELVIHEATCQGLTKAPSTVDLANIKADQDVLISLLPMQVRLIRCDTLIDKKENGYCDIALIKPDFGLDKKSVYPYFPPLKIKQEPMIPIDQPLKPMVSINPDVTQLYSKYVHWDSESDSGDDQENNTLVTRCLKVIFSKQMLGKVPRKRKRAKTDKAFDCLSDNDGEYNIDNIIVSLGFDIDNDKNLDVGNDSETNVVDNENDYRSKFKANEDIKLVRIDIENTEDESDNTDLVPDSEALVTSEINNTSETGITENQTSHVKMQDESSFPKVDSLKTNETALDVNTNGTAGVQVDDNSTGTCDKTDLRQDENDEYNVMESEDNSTETCDKTDLEHVKNNEFNVKESEDNSTETCNKTDLGQDKNDEFNVKESEDNSTEACDKTGLGQDKNHEINDKESEDNSTETCDKTGLGQDKNEEINDKESEDNSTETCDKTGLGQDKKHEINDKESEDNCTETCEKTDLEQDKNDEFNDKESEDNNIDTCDKTDLGQDENDEINNKESKEFKNNKESASQNTDENQVEIDTDCTLHDEKQNNIDDVKSPNHNKLNSMDDSSIENIVENFTNSVGNNNVGNNDEIVLNNLDSQTTNLNEVDLKEKDTNTQVDSKEINDDSITRNSDTNVAKSVQIYENNTKTNEKRIEIATNHAHNTNNGTEMDDLMKDLSDLSKTDDIQQDKVNNITKFNTEKTESDTENDKFMKELDEQIGENSNEPTDIKQNNHSEAKTGSDGTNKVDNFDDLNKINNELEQRMQQDLDCISDEEFDFDA